MYKRKLTGALANKLDELRAQRAFDPLKWADSRAAALNAYVAKAGMHAVLVSVSGGIDSSVTVALAAHAMKMQNSPIKRVVGLMQPIHSTKSIQNRAHLLAPLCELFEVDQSDVFDILHKRVDSEFKTESSAFFRGNLKSYMRTPTAFYAAQLVGALVIGTGNYDEDGFLFYFCKAGDGISDIQLIHDLHKAEVYQVGRALGLHPDLTAAVPSADLWDGYTDEDEIGYGYDHVELLTELIRRNEVEAFEATLYGADAQEFASMKTRLFQIHERNKHKEKFPLNIQ